MTQTRQFSQYKQKKKDPQKKYHLEWSVRKLVDGLN